MVYVIDNNPTPGYKLKKIRIGTQIVRPSVPATAITLNKSSIELDTAGATEQLTATLTPADSTSTVSWSSSDTSIATVSQSGLVTCVTPGSCTITATTSNGLTATCGVAAGRLPSAYQEVEYIANTSGGGQYIDTGIANVSINTRLEYSYTPMANNSGLLFMDNGWDSNGIGNGWTYYYYGSYNSSWSFSSNVIGTKYDFVISNTECSRNGADKIVPGRSSLNPIGTVLLFVNRRSGSVDTGYFSSSKCHYYRRYDNGTLVQELVPCYRKSDGVIGMYDIINNNFLTNQGSGTFTKGPDVN